MKLGDQIIRIFRMLARGLAPLSLLALFACSDLGFQGGIIPTNFTGIRSLQAISPESFQLVWDPFPGATEYKLYVPDLNESVAKPSFTTFITHPIGNAKDDGSYSFSVTAVDPLTGSEQGLRSNYSTVKLLPRFSFDGTVEGIRSTGVFGIHVTWTAYPLVNYRVYVSELLASGAVNYNFVTSSASVTGQGAVDVTGLKSGREYCAVVVASYLDGTSDGPNGAKLTSPLSSLLVGPSGSFGDSIVAQTQKCGRTAAVGGFGEVVKQSSVFVSKGVPSNYPTFHAQVGSDSIEDSSGPAKVYIYQVDPVTELGTLVGYRIGTGTITSTLALKPGRYKFFALFEDQTPGSTAQEKVEITVGMGASGPTPTPVAGKINRSWVFVRGLGGGDSELGNYPEPQQGGRGSSKIGSSVAMGDFNCDGRYDLAIGMPDVSETLSDNRPAKLGRVMIYYDVKEPSAISACTRSQTITFDISDQYTAGRDLRLGTGLFVGNFNQDNQKTNNPPAFPGDENENFKCDDLVISSGYGPMFILYGKRDTITPATTCSSETSPLPNPRPDGGLNYQGAKSFTTNPSAACAPSTGLCQPSMYTFSNPTIKLGRAFAMGDYDGDGYPDLAASSNSSNGIWVLRGSEYGLIAPNKYDPEGVQTTTGPGRLSFPYIPADVTAFPEQLTAPLNHITKPSSAGWAQGSFGASLGTLRNAYYDYYSSATATTRRMRDVLLVGSPGTPGRVFACIPKTITSLGFGSSFTDDSSKNLAWDCNHTIDPPTQYGPAATATNISPVSFGSAMADFTNPLRYKPDDFIQNNTCNLMGNNAKVAVDFANCDTNTKMLGYPGAVAIGASGSNHVFVYYGVARPDATANSRDDLGLARNAYLNNLLTPANQTSAVLDTPCTSATATTESCLIQLITQASSPSGNFGSVMAALQGNNVESTANNPRESILAVAAPNKSITVGSTTYSSVGSVQLFQQKSNYSNDPMMFGDASTFITSRFSSGFSRTLTSTIDYDGTLTDRVYFGSGGIASGPLESLVGGGKYSPNSDIVIGAPGHIRNKDSSGNTIPTVYDNGAALVLFSHGGTMRNYRVGAPTSPDSKWHIIDAAVSSDGLATPVGQESDIHFHQAISIGDIDQDGIGDVAVRIARGSSRNMFRIYSGAPCTDPTGLTCQVKLKKSPGSYVDFNVPGDTSAGFRLIPTGPLRGGSYGSFFITGASESYLYFGGTTGIIQGVPSNSGSPRRMGGGFGAPDLPSGAGPSGATYLPFNDANFYNAEDVSLGSTIRTYASFASGDFNGDGYIDFAFAEDSSSTDAAGIVDSSNPATRYMKATTTSTGTGRGRVYIFYGGSADNGFQIQADPNGGYPLQTEYLGQDGKTYGFATYSKSGTGQTNGTPCSLVNGNYFCNKAQVLAEPLTLSFGDAITSVPLGMCGDKPVSGLAVRAQYPATTVPAATATSKVYLYKPKCLTSANDYSGINSASIITLTGLGLSPPATASTTLGYSMTSATRIMGDAASPNLSSHLIISDQSARRVYVLPVLNGDVVLPTASVQADFTNNGGRSIDYSTSTFLSGLSGSAVGFATTASSLGDINGDGFEDIGLNMSKLNRPETNETFTSQGGALILFGGTSGLQSHTGAILIQPAESTATNKVDCFVKKVANVPTSFCNPLLYFAPQPASSQRKGAYEQTFLTQYSRISTGTKNATNTCTLSTSPNECLGSFIFGVPGRDTVVTPPTKPVLQGGVFYVVP